jgi:hypothetical protein
VREIREKKPINILRKDYFTVAVETFITSSFNVVRARIELALAECS